MMMYYRKWIRLLILFYLVGVMFVDATPVYAKEDIELYARSALLMDASNGRVLFEENGYEKMPMASTTKIMTCLLAIEYKKDHEKRCKEVFVEASANACKMPKVHLGMQQGEQFAFEDLLYSLMLESDNDTAVALAEYMDGSVEAFAERMNIKAKELGCEQTYFVTPNGLDATLNGKEHSTTAYDLAKIAACAIKDREFRTIIATREYHFMAKNTGRSFTVANHNLFLDLMDGAFGIKTGFTNRAGYCFVGALQREGRTYVGVLLGCGWPPNKNWKWQDIKTLMTYGLEKFQLRSIQKKHNFPKLDVVDGVENQVAIELKTEERREDLTLLLGEDETSSCQVILEENLHAPVMKGQQVGYVEYYVGDSLYKKYDIVAKKSIKLRTYSYCMRQIFMLYF